MKTRLAIVLFSILCAGSGTVTRAVCVGASVNSFGAKGDGHTDDTTAIQRAINAVNDAGGGSVVFNVARYFTPFVQGLYRRENASVYVSNGLGTIGVPVRLGAPPEVSVLRLCAI